MAADKIDLEIVTPKGRALAATVDEVTAPSVQGEFGVLPGHLPVLAALRTGLVTYRTGADSKTCAVGPGFVEAGEDKLLLLTEDFIERPQVDPVVVRKELADVQAKIDKLAGVTDMSAETRAERKQLIDRENWLAVQLELYGDPPPATMRPFEEYGPLPPPEEEEPDAEKR